MALSLSTDWRGWYVAILANVFGSPGARVCRQGLEALRHAQGTLSQKPSTHKTPTMSLHCQPLWHRCLQVWTPGWPVETPMSTGLDSQVTRSDNKQHEEPTEPGSGFELGYRYVTQCNKTSPRKGQAVLPARRASLKRDQVG